MSVSLGSLVVGFTTAWSAPATAALQQPDSKLQLSDTEASWVGSAMPLAALLGGLAAGPGLERTQQLCSEYVDTSLDTLAMFGESEAASAVRKIALSMVEE